ncbi:MAG TPA: tail fiber protein [Bacteroidia bacterium]
MEKLLSILIALFSVILTSSAQVGIGGVPNANSILDLTNGTKWLILPKSPASPALNPTFVSTEASLYYYNSNLYLSGLSGVNVLTPWKWDGTATGFISSLPGNPVGIGLVPTVTNFSLSVAQVGEVVAASGGSGSIMVGTPAAKHLLIDDDEIMVKTNPTTAGVLKLQEESGTVDIRSASMPTTATVLNVNGSINASGVGKMKENGNDLLPTGAIIMWSGSAIPAGWALCDGGSYTKMDGTGSVTTPNLMDRFIVGADLTGGTGAAVGSYAIANTGGENTHILTNAEMPSHNHTGFTSTTGSHDHGGFTGDAGYAASSTDPAVSWTTTNVADDSGTHNHTIAPDGDHQHTIPLQGGGIAHENRPPFYALAYIYKL